MRKLPVEVSPHPSPESPGLLSTIEPPDMIEMDVEPRVRVPPVIVRMHPVAYASVTLRSRVAEAV